MSDTRVSGTRSLASFGPRAASAPEGVDGAAAPGDHVGEVVESSTMELVAQARRLHGAPDFGAFVRVESDGASLLGTVFNARTASVEPNRRPTAYGKTEAQLRREQPQIFELLRTQFEVLVLGYVVGRAVVHGVPPQPARIHSFVYPCEDAHVVALTEDDQFLRSLLAAPGVPADELVLACLGQALAVRPQVGPEYLARMGSELSRLLRDDYDRLRSLVRRLAGRRPA